MSLSPPPFPSVAPSLSPPSLPRSTYLPVAERVVSSLSPTADVIALPAYARPKTLPLAWNAGAGAVQRALLNTPAFGQVIPWPV